MHMYIFNSIDIQYCTFLIARLCCIVYLCTDRYFVVFRLYLTRTLQYTVELAFTNDIRISPHSCSQQELLMRWVQVATPDCFPFLTSWPEYAVRVRSNWSSVVCTCCSVRHPYPSFSLPQCVSSSRDWCATVGRRESVVRRESSQNLSIERHRSFIFRFEARCSRMFMQTIASHHQLLTNVSSGLTSPIECFCKQVTSSTNKPRLTWVIWFPLFHFEEEVMFPFHNLTAKLRHALINLIKSSY